jgi:thiamine biosynthesis lipoprotein
VKPGARTCLAVFGAFAMTAACAAPRHQFEWEMMGTYLRVTIVGAPRPAAEAAANAAFAAVADVDSLLSIYKPESDFSRVNRAAGVETLAVSGQTMEVLEASRRFYVMTEGAFDPSVGPLMRLWKLQDEGRVPEPAEIDSTLRLIGYSKVHIDPSSRNVYLPAGMRLDSGGVGKGYAADIARATLARHGITRCMVDLGGNLAVLGRGPTRGNWAVGIRNPLHRDLLIGSLEITDMAVATSGQYEQYFIRDGTRYGHIVDPRNGMPANGMLSATVLAADATTTDCLSTGVFVLGPDRGMALVEQLPGIEAIIVLDPGVDRELTRSHILVSSGLRDRIRWAIP